MKAETGNFLKVSFPELTASAGRGFIFSRIFVFSERC
jgi:hypothetical protein